MFSTAAPNWKARETLRRTSAEAIAGRNYVSRRLSSSPSADALIALIRNWSDEQTQCVLR